MADAEDDGGVDVRTINERISKILDDGELPDYPTI